MNAMSDLLATAPQVPVGLLADGTTAILFFMLFVLGIVSFVLFGVAVVIRLTLRGLWLIVSLGLGLRRESGDGARVVAHVCQHAGCNARNHGKARYCRRCGMALNTSTQGRVNRAYV